MRMSNIMGDETQQNGDNGVFNANARIEYTCKCKLGRQGACRNLLAAARNVTNKFSAMMDF